MDIRKDVLAGVIPEQLRKLQGGVLVVNVSKVEEIRYTDADDIPLQGGTFEEDKSNIKPLQYKYDELKVTATDSDEGIKVGLIELELPETLLIEIRELL